MKHKLGVCVPYRNREEHLKEFVPTISKFLQSKGIEFGIYLGHQIDDKLFNRGAMKNIAAKQAFDDGCDYVVWHDIDMVPEDDTCDYSYPIDNPQHIAVNISQSDYNLKYEQYFGGAVLFTKEQVEATNGYSNDYWDWGMEDDDLFWRCVKEGMVETTTLDYIKEKQVAEFDGTSSFIKIPNRFGNVLNNSHTISVLVNSAQQIEKVPIWLIGDSERRFVEYPIFRKPGYDWGLSFNNSRAYTAMLWNANKEQIYQWFKRYENEWTWVTMVVDTAKGKMHFYLNGRESSARNGTGTSSPIQLTGLLKHYGSEPYYIGRTPSVSTKEPNAFFKGQISDIKFWNRALKEIEVTELHKKYPNNGLILHYDFTNIDTDNQKVIDSINENNGTFYNVQFKKENISIPYVILPYRKNGRFKCLPHKTEGLITEGGIDKWAKGETTARNERRYILEMQQDKIDYKNDGIANILDTMDIIEFKKDMYPNTTFINVKMK
jgi:hypothetical protein